MAQLPYRANLSSGYYPFLTRFHGRSVIVPGQDQFYKNRLTLSNTNESPEDEGIPQLYYVENVMPAANGFKSVGYLTELEGLPGEMNFSDIFVLRDINENKFLFSPANGNNYIYNANNFGWEAMSGANSDLVTVAYINGRTLIFFKGVGCYEYNSTTNTLDVVTFIGVVMTALNGICASSGFLIAWDAFSVYRSKITNILDFIPDATAGSGSSIPEDIKGQIVACLPTIAGFIIYTTKNAVGASFSQNIRYPFIYKEVQGSAGITHPREVSWKENIAEHYAWTVSGVQKVSKTQAVNIFPAVTDFLTSNLVENLNPITNLLEETIVNSDLQVRMEVIQQTFLVISYGIDTYTDAIVFDLTYKRWGRLKINHTAAFELIIPNLSGDLSWEELGTLSWDDLATTSWEELGSQILTQESPNETLAFLQADGRIVTVDFSENSTGHAGVAIVGKYQYERNRFLSAQETNIECENVESNFDTYIMASIDGKNIEFVEKAFLSYSNGLARTYNSEAQGKNLSFLLKGSFHITSLDFLFKLESRM